MNSGTNDISVLVELFILTPRERNNLKVVFFLLLHTLEKIKQILLEENLRPLPLLFFQNSSWLVPKHSGANYPIYIRWSQRDGDNVRKSTKCLTVDWHKILSTQLHQLKQLGQVTHC